MTYASPNERVKFANLITETLDVLRDPNDAPYLKGEFFGYFVNRVVRKFLIDPDYTGNSFNSYFFNEAKKKLLTHSADSISALVNRSDPIASAAELNYAITAILWGFLGDAAGCPAVGYGLRAYLRAVITKISQSIETVNSGSQRDMTMAFRRHLIIRGVLDDIVSETYRIKTIPYEDEKRRENGDIWKDGKLVLPETAVTEAE